MGISVTVKWTRAAYLRQICSYSAAQRIFPATPSNPCMILKIPYESESIWKEDDTELHVPAPSTSAKWDPIQPPPVVKWRTWRIFGSNPGSALPHIKSCFTYLWVVFPLFRFCTDSYLLEGWRIRRLTTFEFFSAIFGVSHISTRNFRALHYDIKFIILSLLRWHNTYLQRTLAHPLLNIY